MAVLGLRFCARAFSSCGKRGPLFIAVRGPLTVTASPVAEHKLQTRRLSSCGSRAQLLRGMWDLPRPGHEPVSPALAGRFLTTVPPGKPKYLQILMGLCLDTQWQCFPETTASHTYQFTNSLVLRNCTCIKTIPFPLKYFFKRLQFAYMHQQVCVRG